MTPDPFADVPPAHFDAASGYRRHEFPELYSSLWTLHRAGGEAAARVDELAATLRAPDPRARTHDHVDLLTLRSGRTIARAPLSG
ncbi:MAG: hypothetical protein AB7K09_17060 [Planctomycetota bacterium]